VQDDLHATIDLSAYSRAAYLAYVTASVVVPDDEGKAKGPTALRADLAVGGKGGLKPPTIADIMKPL
jgi:hypothetical protein